MARPQQTSTEAILDSLAAHPEVTVADLADVLGIGQSTAAKHLAALEVAGTARREPGGREGGQRVADRWSATAPATDDAALDGADHAAPDGPCPARPTDSPVASWARSYGRTWLAARARTSDPPNPELLEQMQHFAGWLSLAEAGHGSWGRAGSGGPWCGVAGLRCGFAWCRSFDATMRRWMHRVVEGV